MSKLITPRSMPLYKPTSLSETEHRERHATILMNQINQYAEKCIIAIDNLQVENDRGMIALLTATNSLADDLQVSLYGLTNIAIGIYKNEHANADITKIAKNLSNYICSIQKSNSADTRILKQELKSGLNGTRYEARQLHQLHKTKDQNALRSSIFNVMENILFAVKMLYNRTIFEVKTPQELKEMKVQIKKRFVCATRKINEEDDGDINNLLKYAFQAITKSYLTVRTIEEEIDAFDDKTNLKLSQIAHSINLDLAVVDNAMHTKDEPDAIKDHITLVARTCCNEMMNLLDIIGAKNPNIELDLNLRNLVLFAVAHQYALGEGITDGVQDLNQN